jgi:hypothetical protein
MKVSNGSIVTNHNLEITGLLPNTYYYYRVVSKAGTQIATSSEYFFKTENVDDQAPYVFNVGVNAGLPTTTISWSTNENSTGKLWYSTSSDIMNAADKKMVADNSLGTSHSISIGSLTPNTLYRFLITATDNGGNTATSTSNLYNFTTPAAPVLNLTGLQSSNVTANAATINWSTSVGADSKVYYSTSTPVIGASNVGFLSEVAMSTNHNLIITGLTASSTYHYVAVSKDAFGQTATSSEMTFTTL